MKFDGHMINQVSYFSLSYSSQWIKVNKESKIHHFVGILSHYLPSERFLSNSFEATLCEAPYLIYP